MAAYKDYYSVLGVPRTADQKEIRAAYRKLAAKHHPDRNPNDAEAEEKFKEVNEAYTVVADPEKRKFYDQYGTAGGAPPFSGAGSAAGGGQGVDAGEFSDFFQTLFGQGFSFGGGSQRADFFTRTRGGARGAGRGDPFDPFGGFQAQQAPRGAEGTLTVDLEEAYRGSTTAVMVGDKRIEVDIPPGCKDGAKLRLRGQAPSGGDLYLTVKLNPHPRFRLEGENVRVTVDVPDDQAVLGGSVRVPTLDGDVEMTLPKGTQSGRVLRLRGQGWPKSGAGRGDMLVEVRVTVPENPSREQLKLYQQLRDIRQKKSAKAAA